jgi:hypothetical protein
MTPAGFQPDLDAETDAVKRLALLHRDWQAAEAETARAAAEELRYGSRANVLATALHMSRSTFYRWLANRRHLRS